MQPSFEWLSAWIILYDIVQKRFAGIVTNQSFCKRLESKPDLVIYSGGSPDRSSQQLQWHCKYPG